MTEPLQGEIVTVPTPILKGTFAVYEAPDGGRIVAYRPDDEADSKQFVIPGLIIRAMEAQARGETINPMKLMRGMMGG